MGIYGEDDLNLRAPVTVTQAAGSNASVDLETDYADIDTNVSHAAQLDLAQALKQAHPDYYAEIRKWTKYMDLYESNDVYRFIHRHLRESDSSWKKRVERGHFYNYVRTVVDIFTAFLYHAPISRGGISPLVEEFHSDSDMQGTTWHVFMQDVCTFSQLTGHVGILVDMPDGDAPISEAQRREKKFRPFVSLIHAKQILDWELDTDRKFKWVKIEISRPDPDRNFRTPADIESRFFQVWTKTGFEEYKVSVGDAGEEIASLVKEGPHPCEEVPLVIVKNGRRHDHPFFGLSSVTDIADINIGILNWSSLGDEEIFERCLNILAMERGEGDAPVELGHGNVLEYEPGGTAPQYLTPGATPLELIQKWCREAREEIRRLGRVNMSVGLGDVRQASSGVAHAFQFVEINQSLASKAHGLEQAEIRVHNLIGKWTQEEFKGSIQYPNEFGVEDILVLFQALGMAKSNFSSETGIKTMEKRVARNLFAREKPELLEQIEEEIEEADVSQPSIESMFGMEPPGGGFSAQPDGEGESEDEPDEESGTVTAA